MKYNFGAGPCILPDDVFKEASDAVLNFNGLSILEVSHRHKDFVEVIDELHELVKKLLNIPDTHSIAFTQGGASLGFTISALTMMRGGQAGYINTGTWASKAIVEAEKVGIDALTIGSSADKNFSYIPKNLEVPHELDFVHFTSNNTIYGTQFQELPTTNSPLVCDMSSDIMSKDINVSDYDLIYAGAQKNLGPAGSTLYIVKNDVLGKSSSTFLPSYLDLKGHVEKGSMLNTPPVFSLYVALLNLRNTIKKGGIPYFEKENNAKANLLYSEIDDNPLFQTIVQKEDRSKMNATFQLSDDSLKTAFDAMCNKADIVGINGHRSVGGYRASMYNALPLSSVQVLVDVMQEFTRTKG